MKTLIAGLIVASGAGLACYCPEAYFEKDAPFEVTVVQSAVNTCEAGRSPSFAAGDSFTLVGTGDLSFEAGMCSNGTLVPDETPWFATDVLTTCDSDASMCNGQTQDGCAVWVQVRVTGGASMSPDGGTSVGSGSGTVLLYWNSSCDPTFKCEERYDVTFNRVPRRGDRTL